MCWCDIDGRPLQTLSPLSFFHPNGDTCMGTDYTSLSSLPLSLPLPGCAFICCPPPSRHPNDASLPPCGLPCCLRDTHTATHRGHAHGDTPRSSHSCSSRWQRREEGRCGAAARARARGAAHRDHKGPEEKEEGARRGGAATSTSFLDHPSRLSQPELSLRTPCVYALSWS